MLLPGCYLLRQGQGQAQLLLARRDVGEVLYDPAVSPERRGRLAFLSHARRFGTQRLGMAGEQLYRSYVDTGDVPVAWNVSACAKDAFEASTWWFPIVGRVPYLGFFEEAEAQQLGAQLRERDLDVLVRPVRGYSTLGWFEDPVFSSTLYGDAFVMARLMLHEMAHATVFFPDAVSFNENFATLVGNRGALALLAHLYGEGSEPVRAAKRRLVEEGRFRLYMTDVVTDLESLYDSDLDRLTKLRKRQRLFEARKTGLVKLLAGFEQVQRHGWLERSWDNALLMSFRRYQGRQEGLKLLLDGQHRGDLRALIDHVAALDAPPKLPGSDPGNEPKP